MPGSAAEPKTDRELLLQLNGDIKNLTHSVEKLTEVLTVIEEKKIGSIDRRLEAIEKWKTELGGAWKLAIIIYTVTTGAIVGLVKWLS